MYQQNQIENFRAGKKHAQITREKMRILASWVSLSVRYAFAKQAIIAHIPTNSLFPAFYSIEAFFDCCCAWDSKTDREKKTRGDREVGQKV